MLPPFALAQATSRRGSRGCASSTAAPALMMRGQGTEFDSLREYVRGDDVRSIDWRATARRRDPAGGGAKLVVRTWRPERDRRIVIIVDSGRTSAARIADEPRLDTSFEASLLLAALATRAGDRIDLAVYDRRVRGRVQGATGAAAAGAHGRRAGADRAGAHRARLVRRARARALDHPAPRPRRASSPRSTRPGTARPLLAMLPQLTRRHTVVVASVTDPDVLAATRETRQRRGGLPRGGRRARAARRGPGGGRHPSDSAARSSPARPPDLPPALADRYLALKAAGRL